MIGLALGVLAYAAVGFVHARFAFRHEYAKLKGQRVPATYGYGWMSPKEKRSRAVREATMWIPFWGPFDLWTATGYTVLGARWLAVRLIAGPQRPEDDLDYSKIGRLERDTGQETSPEVPSGGRVVIDEIGTLARTPCPCGYLTECHIHCGDGSQCHGAMGRTLDATERRAVRNTFHPETGARPDPWLWDTEPEFIGTADEWRKMMRLYGIDPGPFVPLDVKPPCAQCRASVVAVDFHKQGRMMNFDLGDRLAKPCTCGRKMIERYWEMRFGS